MRNIIVLLESTKVYGKLERLQDVDGFKFVDSELDDFQSTQAIARIHHQRMKPTTAHLLRRTSKRRGTRCISRVIGL